MKNVFFLSRKVTFKSYEERSPAAEKMCREAEQMKNVFSRLQGVNDVSY